MIGMIFPSKISSLFPPSFVSRFGKSDARLEWGGLQEAIKLVANKALFKQMFAFSLPAWGFFLARWVLRLGRSWGGVSFS